MTSPARGSEVEGLSERERRALENIILALKAGDRETAKLILEEEISDKNKEKVMRYLKDLGFVPPTVKVPRRGPKVIALEPKVRQRRTTIKNFPIEAPKLLPELRRPKRPEKKLELTKVNIKETALMLISAAENEIMLASEDIPKDVLKLLKMKAEEGISIKLLLLSTDCKTLKFWGFKTKYCVAKELTLGTAARVPPALVAYALPAALPPNFYSLLGVPAGLSLPALYAMAALELLYWKPAYAYTFLPWSLKIATIVSFLSLLLGALWPKKRYENVEIRLSDALPATLLIVDDRRALSSECPLSSGPCLATVYREGAYAISREFSLLWEGARPLR